MGCLGYTSVFFMVYLLAEQNLFPSDAIDLSDANKVRSFIAIGGRH